MPRSHQKKKIRVCHQSAFTVHASSMHWIVCTEIIVFPFETGNDVQAHVLLEPFLSSIPKLNEMKWEMPLKTYKYIKKHTNGDGRAPSTKSNDIHIYLFVFELEFFHFFLRYLCARGRFGRRTGTHMNTYNIIIIKRWACGRRQLSACNRLFSLVTLAVALSVFIVVLRHSMFTN